jgi:hypothetical protein
MESRVLSSICKQVYQKYPAVSGAEPKVAEQKAPTGVKAEASYLITFKGSATGADGRKIACVVRVVANENGKILKISSSK